jgi:two-component system sensor kinase FixL
MVAVVSASVVVGSWYLLNLRDHEHIQKMTEDAAGAMAGLVRRDLESRVSALQLLAHHRELAQDAGHESWKADVAAYIADLPGYQAIEWADASMQVRRTVSLKGNEAAGGIDFASLPDALRAAQQAQSTRQIVVTPPIGTDEDGDIMTACLPVYQDDQFAGLVIGVFRIIPWLDDVLMRGGASNYDVGISIGGRPVYAPPSEVSFPGNRWFTERTLSLYGLDWHVQIAPTAQFASTIHSQLSMAVMVLGLILSAFLGWTIHLTLHARQQAQLLKNSASHLTELLKNLPGMAFRFTIQESWPAEFVSEGCQDMCGYSKSQFEQHLVFWGDLVHPDDRVSLWGSVQEAVGRNREFEHEYRIITRDGKEKWVWSRGRRIYAGHGKADYLEGLVMDITKRKQAATALVDAEAYAKAVVETAAEAVITIDDEGRIETFNRAAQQMFGYTLEEIVGRNVRTLLSEQQNTEKDHHINRLFDSASLPKAARGRDATGRRKDGSSLPIRLSVSEVHDHTGHKLVGLIRDLSEQRAAELEASEHRERLAHVDRLNMLGEMATGIAHEINQPLSAISMYAQSGMRFLDAAVPRPERLRDALEKLGLQAHRAGTIIERMQQLSKQHETQRESVDGNLLMKQVHALAETEARMRNMEIKLDLCPQRRRISGDSVQIQQVALNLLRNGMEAMEISGRHHGSHIVLRTECGNDGFKILVIDSGTGVSREVAEKLYQPFSTTKKTGMGLGLSICRSIISAHGGEMGYINNDHGGATFYFVLPYAKRTSDEIS